jgi:hypothetical protein
MLQKRTGPMRDQCETEQQRHGERKRGSVRESALVIRAPPGTDNRADRRRRIVSAKERMTADAAAAVIIPGAEESCETVRLARLARDLLECT